MSWVVLREDVISKGLSRFVKIKCTAYIPLSVWMWTRGVLRENADMYVDMRATSQPNTTLSLGDEQDDQAWQVEAKLLHRTFHQPVTRQAPINTQSGTGEMRDSPSQKPQIGSSLDRTIHIKKLPKRFSPCFESAVDETQHEHSDSGTRRLV